MGKVSEVAEKEVLRAEILEILEQSMPVGADGRVLKAALRKGGSEVSQESLAAALYYLEGKGLITMQEVHNRALGISRSIARITPAGIDLLDGNAEASGVSLSEGV